MPDPLPTLIGDRSTLLRQISELGDFQPGSITSATRRCGSPVCHGAKPNDPAHGPHFQLTQKVEGKTVTQNLPSPAAVGKAESEIAEFRKFQTLTGELVDVNRKICRLRPVEQTEQTAQEKKRRRPSNQEVAREVDRFLRIVFQQRRNSVPFDLEAVETALRSAMHQAGASALAQLLRYDPPDADSRTIPCPCGHAAHYQELRSRNVLTVLGPVTLSRPYYVCADCSKGQYPADAALGVAGLESSPGVRRMEAVVGSEMPFAPGCEPMKLLSHRDHGSWSATPTWEWPASGMLSATESWAVDRLRRS
jgi:hypothetical protein